MSAAILIAARPSIRSAPRTARGFPVLTRRGQPERFTLSRPRTAGQPTTARSVRMTLGSSWPSQRRKRSGRPFWGIGPAYGLSRPRYPRWSPPPLRQKAPRSCNRPRSRSVRNSTPSSAGAVAARARSSNTSRLVWAEAATTRHASTTLARTACTILSTIRSSPRAGRCR